MSIVVMGAVFVDIKGYPLSSYIPGGRNAGRVVQVHGGVSRNIVEDIANVELRPTFVSLVDYTSAGAVIGQTYGKTMMESCEIGTRLAASVITTGENVCPRYLPSEFGLDVPTVDDAQIALEF